MSVSPSSIFQLMRFIKITENDSRVRVCVLHKSTSRSIQSNIARRMELNESVSSNIGVYIVRH